jgi:hypothetical protein
VLGDEEIFTPCCSARQAPFPPLRTGARPPQHPLQTFTGRNRSALFSA